MDIKNVINQYYDMVHKIAYSKTQSVNDADDLTQEVFLKYLQSDKKFDSDDHIKKWLIRVTINTYFHKKGKEKLKLNGRKIPAENLEVENYWTEIDDTLDVQDCEMVMTKYCMSCFGKPEFEKYLQTMDIDIIMIAGVTASGAIRYTVMDAHCRGYNVIVVKDAIADRIPGAVYWNLFDMEMNFAKTMSTDNAIKLIEQYS